MLTTKEQSLIKLIDIILDDLTRFDRYETSNSAEFDVAVLDAKHFANRHAVQI